MTKINYNQDVDFDPTTGIQAKNRDALIVYLGKLEDSLKEKGTYKDVDYILTIKLPCGCTKKFKSKGDAPETTLKCEHGNYFVKYEDD